MALTLNLNPGANDLQISPNTNGVYAQCVSVPILGNLTSDSNDTLDSIDITEASITVVNLTFDGSPPTFPYTINTSVLVNFDIIPSGSAGNTDQFQFQFNFVPFGNQIFTYDVTELDIQDSITIANNTLPLAFGSVQVGSLSDVSFVVNNETCVRYPYDISTDTEITFGGNTAVTITPFPRTIATLVARWEPTAVYNLGLGGYGIYCDMECGQGLYQLTGVSTPTPPPPVGVASRKKLIISNGISI